MKIKTNLLLLFAALLCYSVNTLCAQTKVTGIITATAENHPVQKANIIIKGSKPVIGTITDDDGKFTIIIPIQYGKPVLIISSVGFTTREIRVVDARPLTIILDETNADLDDVVVVGYATVRRRDLTGSVSSVGEKDLKDIPINSAEQALTGRLAGVQVTTAEGIPGAESRILIRGGTSVNQDNSPLFIIDGVQVEDGLASISPQDIESVTVLKDASATAIYGARGSNGVILVTTKGGKKGRMRVTYNGFYGTNRLAKKLDVLIPYDFVLYQYERSRINAGEQASFDGAYGTSFDSLSRFRTVEAIDWQQLVLGEKADMQTHNVSMSGGSNKLKYNASYAYNQQKGTVINTSYERHLFNIKTDYTSGKFKVGISTRYAHAVPRGVGTSDGGNASYNRLRAVVKYKPFNKSADVPVDEFDEDYFNETNSGNSLGIVNPFVADNSEFRTTKNDLANTSVYVDYKISKKFAFRASGGYNYNETNSYSYFDTLSSTARQKGGGNIMAGITNRNNQTVNQSNVLTFTKRTRKSDLSILGGQEIYISRTKGAIDFVRDIPLGTNKDHAFDNISSYQQLAGYPVVSYFKSTLLSFFSRANYTYNKRYLFTATLRADGSSKFAEGKKWGYFPSGSFAWRVSSEKFMKKHAKTFADVKFRVSYGLTGNNRIGDYRYQNSYKTSLVYPLLDSITNLGYEANYLANSNLTWETTESKNIGVDAGLFKNKLQVSVDVYHNKTNDVLISVPIPNISGYPNQLQNVATTVNKGVELQLAATLVEKKNFSWSGTFNISFNKNEVLKLAKNQDSYLTSSGWGVGTPSDYIVQVGRPVGSMYGYIVDGFYKVEDFDYNTTTQQLILKAGVVKNTIISPQPGSIKFKDINGDKLAGAEDRDIIGDATPKFYGGLNQQFTFRKFDASVFINFQYGNDVFNANKLEFTNGFAPGTNLIKEMRNRWRTIDERGNLLQYYNTTSGIATTPDPAKLAQVNTDAAIWLPLTGANGYLPTSYAVEDGSFIRINNITVGYTFDQSGLIKRAGIKRLRAYITLNNLAVITSYSGYDPEVNTRRSSPVTPGVDYSAYPRSRSYFLGLNLSF